MWFPVARDLCRALIQLSVESLLRQTAIVVNSYAEDQNTCTAMFGRS